LKIESAEFVLSAHGAEGFLRDGLPQVAFIGRSNVGKSSLMNALVGRKGLARTSSTPGRTRSVNYFLLNRRLYFVDLPGYGYAKAGKEERREWAQLVDRYFHQASQSGERVRVIQLVDAKVGATPLDGEAIAYMRAFALPVTVVATKVDRIGRSRQPAMLAAIRQNLNLPAEQGPIAASVRTGEGFKELWRVIDAHLSGTAS